MLVVSASPSNLRLVDTFSPEDATLFSDFVRSDSVSWDGGHG